MGNNRLIKTDITTTLVIVISVFLLVFNFVRILNVPVTHDEAFTYNLYLSGAYNDIWHSGIAFANNHLLNSLLTKTIINIFNNSDPFHLRLTNLMAFVMYLIYSFLLLKALLKNNNWILVGFILLNFNPYMFEFWGLCCGYGLSIALMIASLHHLVRFAQNRFRHLLYATIFAVLAVFANFVLLNYFLAFLFITVVITIRKKERLLKTIGVAALSSGLLYFLIADHIKTLREREQLYYGGDNGVVRDTLSTLVSNSFYIDDVSQVSAISYTIAAIFLAAGVYWLLQLRNKGAHSVTGFLLWCTVFIPVLSVEMQHQIFDNKYIIGRTALFLYPLFMVQFGFWLFHIRKFYSSSGSTVMLGLSILFIGNFKQHANTNIAKDWEYDRYNKLIIERVLKNTAPGKLTRIRLSWELIPSFIYYSNTEYSGRFYPIERREENFYEGLPYDYLYLSSYYTEAEDPGQFYGVYEQDTAFHDVQNVLYKQVGDQ